MKTPVPDNAMLVLALRHISDGVCISDMNDHIIYVNDSFAGMYGYSEEELLGKPVGMIRSDSNLPEVVNGIFNATLEGGWKGELMNRRKDGTEFPVYISTAVIPDEQGQPLAMIGTTQDITQTRKMQDRFRAVADLFRDLGADVQQNIQTILECACSVMGATCSLYQRLDEKSSWFTVTAGYRLPEGFPAIYPAPGRIGYETTFVKGPGPVALGNLSGSVYTGTDPFISDFGFNAYIGAEVTRRGIIIGTLSVYDTSAREFSREEIDLIGILAKAVSVEEDRQDSLSLFETAIGQSPTGIIIADSPEIRVRVANSKAADLLQNGSRIRSGGSLGEEFRRWKVLFPNGTPMTFEQFPLARAIEHGDVMENVEMIFFPDGETPTIVSVNAAPVRDNEGNISSGVMVFHNITARQKAENELKIKMAELERFNNLMIGRELKMMELKKEVNELLVNVNKPEKYRVTG
ncbi:MAG TPA: PAS domain S-box protein [Bacteroidales bacterium]|nr:PAS domain S-box protein [Bacteroidales bacterium]HPS63156.1 PAS domain S-box protein [Bacteroidales bacterium]